MLECIHSLVTVHKYPLISMKRHLMEGQSDKHVQAFTHSPRKRKGENVTQICLLNSKVWHTLCAFSAPCPRFIRLKRVLAKAKLLDRFWKLVRHYSYFYFLVAKSGSLLCHLEAVTVTQSPVECLVKSKEGYLLQNPKRKYCWVCF